MSLNIGIGYPPTAEYGRVCGVVWFWRFRTTTADHTQDVPVIYSIGRRALHPCHVFGIRVCCRCVGNAVPQHLYCAPCSFVGFYRQHQHRHQQRPEIKAMQRQWQQQHQQQRRGSPLTTSEWARLQHYCSLLLVRTCPLSWLVFQHKAIISCLERTSIQQYRVQSICIFFCVHFLSPSSTAVCETPHTPHPTQANGDGRLCTRTSYTQRQQRFNTPTQAVLILCGYSYVSYA